MFMFDEDMRNEFFWNNSAFGEDFYRNRILEANPLNLAQNERDSAYLWEMYPKESKIIRRLVEEALDMEDYRGSFIYDEYPDKYLFFRMVTRIANQYMNQQSVMAGTADTEVEKNSKNPWLMEVVQVILANEIFRRRNRRKFW